MSKEVAKKESAEVALYDFGTDAGKGFENQTQEDVTLPFLKILEGLSPQVAKKVGEGGVTGARPGMLFNSVTETLTDGDEGLVIVPAFTQHVFVEWRPERGGFVAVHQLDSQVVKDAKAGSPEFGVYSTDYTRREGKWPFAGNELVETFYVYAIEELSGNPVVLAFTSTRISGYKVWNSKLSMFQVPGPGGSKVQPPMYANRVRVRTVAKSSGQQTWSTFGLTPAEGGLRESLIAPKDPRYVAAKQLKTLIEAGFAKVDHASAQGSASRRSGDPAPEVSGDVPF